MFLWGNVRTDEGFGTSSPLNSPGLEILTITLKDGSWVLVELSYKWEFLGGRNLSSEPGNRFLKNVLYLYAPTCEMTSSSSTELVAPPGYTEMRDRHY